MLVISEFLQFFKTPNWTGIDALFTDMEPRSDNGRLALSRGLITLFQCLGLQSRNRVNTAEKEKLSLENTMSYGENTGRIIYGYMRE